MSDRPTETDLVTGAFSYSGSRIAQLLIDARREVRTLTHHPDREHPLRARVVAAPYRFRDPVALVRSLDGITTLYNTYLCADQLDPIVEEFRKLDIELIEHAGGRVIAACNARRPRTTAPGPSSARPRGSANTCPCESCSNRGRRSRPKH